MPRRRAERRNDNDILVPDEKSTKLSVINNNVPKPRHSELRDTGQNGKPLKLRFDRTTIELLMSLKNNGRVTQFFQTRSNHNVLFVLVRSSFAPTQYVYSYAIA